MFTFFKSAKIINTTATVGEEGATMRRKKTKKGGGIDPRVTRNITEEEVLRRIAGRPRLLNIT